MKLISKSDLTSLIIVGFIFWMCMCSGTETPTATPPPEEKVACPDKYGICNTCIDKDGVVVALTRIICADYSIEHCLVIYNGPAGICDDGCNICTCLDKGISATRLQCVNETLTECMKIHPEGSWPCQSSICTCTKYGVRFIA